MTDTSFDAGQMQLGEIAQHSPAVHTPKARNRKERLAFALAHLERGGITGAEAYRPFLRKLAQIGIIIKPPYYRSWASMIIVMMLILFFVTALVLVAVVLTGVMPRPVQGMINAGPTVYFVGTFVFGLGIAAVQKNKAKQIGLPRWRDL